MSARFWAADANEVAEAWRVILQLRHAPAALVLSRQAMPTLDRTKYASAAGLAQGGYVLADAPAGEPEVQSGISAPNPNKDADGSEKTHGSTRSVGCRSRGSRGNR